MTDLLWLLVLLVIAVLLENEMSLRRFFRRAVRPETVDQPDAPLSQPASEDLKRATQLQLCLEDILGVTSEQARLAFAPDRYAAVAQSGTPSDAVLADELCRAYKALWRKARSELESAYESFFERFKAVRVDAGFLKRGLREERSQPRTESARALLDEIEAELSRALSLSQPTPPGESPLAEKITAGDLRRLLMKLFLPNIKGLWSHKMTDGLETILRLAPLISNGLGYAIYAEDAEGRSTMDETVEVQMGVLRHQWHFYQKAFPPGIRIEASYDFVVERNAQRIFDHVEGWASPRLSKPEQAEVISALRRAFATKLLYQSERGRGNGPMERIVFERDYLRPYLGSDYFSPLKELLGATDFARLTAWLAEAAQDISSQPRPQSTLGDRIFDLEIQLEELKYRPAPWWLHGDAQTAASVLEPAAGAKSENETLLDGLVAALSAPEPGNLVDNYCEFLWQKSIDEAIARGGMDAESRRDWRRLELMRKLILVGLKVQSSEISRFSPAGWRRS